MTALKNEWFMFVQMSFRAERFSGPSRNARLATHLRWTMIPISKEGIGGGERASKTSRLLHATESWLSSDSVGQLG